MYLSICHIHITDRLIEENAVCKSICLSFFLLAFFFSFLSDVPVTLIQKIIPDILLNRKIVGFNFLEAKHPRDRTLIL